MCRHVSHRPPSRYLAQCQDPQGREGSPDTGTRGSSPGGGAGPGGGGTGPGGGGAGPGGGCVGPGGGGAGPGGGGAVYMYCFIM